MTIVDEYIKFWTVYLTEPLTTNISPSPMFCVCPKISSRPTRKCDKMCVKTPRQQWSDVLFAVHSRRMPRSIHWRVGTRALQARNSTQMSQHEFEAEKTDSLKKERVSSRTKSDLEKPLRWEKHFPACQKSIWPSAWSWRSRSGLYTSTLFHLSTDNLLFAALLPLNQRVLQVLPCVKRWPPAYHHILNAVFIFWI